MPLKYPCAFSRLEISAGLTALYRCALMTRTCESDVCCGEEGLEGVLESFSNNEVDVMLSYWREYLLLVEDIGAMRPEFGGRGDPDDDGVYARLEDSTLR